MTKSEFAVTLIGVIMLVSAIFYMFKNNVGGSVNATNIESITYHKDSRTGLCFAQSFRRMAAASCDKIPTDLLEEN